LPPLLQRAVPEPVKALPAGIPPLSVTRSTLPRSCPGSRAMPDEAEVPPSPIVT
jgi:hypothetical protein